MSSVTNYRLWGSFALQGKAGKKGEESESPNRSISLYESWPQICFPTASESGEMSVGLLFFLYNVSRNFLEHPAYSAKKIPALSSVHGNY